MNENFDACVAVTLRFEGGFADNPADPGGATNFGVTLRTLHAWEGHPVTADDVRAMTRDEAVAILGAKYWNVVRGDDLPLGVDLMVFDFAVNAGPATSARMLQRCAGLAGHEVDGSIGPYTLRIVRAQPASHLISALGAARNLYYRSLPVYPTFGDGWSARVSACMGEAQAMALGVALDAQETPEKQATANQQTGTLAVPPDA